MKKKVLLLAAAAMLSMGASAQLSLGLKAGYAFPSHGMDLGTSTKDGNSTTIYGTNGKGIPVSAEVGYFFTDNIGVQLDASFLIGTEVTHNEVLTAGFESREYTKTNQLRLSPQIVIKSKLGIYGRIGMVLPVMGKTTGYKEDVSNPYDGLVPGFAGKSSKGETEYKGKFSIGFIASLGYEFSLNDRFSIFGEMEYISLGIKRATKQTTVFEIDGTSYLGSQVLPNAPTNEEIEYEDEVDNSATNPPAQGTKSAYHSIGLNIGVRFTLGGGK